MIDALIENGLVLQKALTIIVNIIAKNLMLQK